jgi:uncharacterized protein
MRPEKNILNEIKTLSKAKFPNAEVYLYGSRARGDANIKSDWDLLILLDEFEISFSGETWIMDFFYELELETGEVITPIIYPKNVWKNRYSRTPIYENLIREGKRII